MSASAWYRVVMLQLAARESLAFLRAHLGGRRRVLDVGCGSGDIAAALARDGHEVTAVDLRLPPAAERATGVTFLEASLLDVEAPPFDALVFVASLHHITPLERAVVHARGLLRPGGLLLVDEFAVEAPDEPTARWYYETQELLASIGRFSRVRHNGHAPHEHAHGPTARGRSHESEAGRPAHAHGHAPAPAPSAPSRAHAPADPLERWRAEHTHDGERLNEGAEMQRAIGAHFALSRVEAGPYLYRYLSAGLAETLPPGDALAEAGGAHLLETEQQGIATGRFKAVGRRFVAE